tara:strand:- start:2184 stop:2537 length:354 start_codon:yes stop_codon:yes gene_type:complete
MMEVINLHPLSDEQDPYGEYQVHPLYRLAYWIEGKLKQKLDPNDIMKTCGGVPATKEEVALLREAYTACLKEDLERAVFLAREYEELDDYGFYDEDFWKEWFPDLVFIQPIPNQLDN